MSHYIIVNYYCEKRNNKSYKNNAFFTTSTKLVTSKWDDLDPEARGDGTDVKAGE